MPKNIVILCDGTSNSITEARSNVLRLYGTLTKSDAQVVYYDPGVGTLGAANAWLRFYPKLLEILGLATGWGLDRNVKEAYRFLVEHYDDGSRAEGEDEDPDRIYLFGFSRGAYTVRVLAGFIHAVGLIHPVNLNLVDYAYRAYKGVSDRRPEIEDSGDRDPATNPFAEVQLYERILRPRRPAIRCVGVFDTVSSVIEWGRVGLRLRYHAFTRTNASVESVRHAVAIDEKRTMFQPQLWTAGQEYWGGPFRPRGAAAKKIARQDLKEVWFSGVHGDVGGGYSERRSGLAKIPLEWMIAETRKLGLAYKTRTINEIVLGRNDSKDYVKPDPLAPRNESMNAAWSMLEYLPRRVPQSRETSRPSWMGWYIPRFEGRQVPAGAAIHNSVFKRRGTPSDYDQPNIPDVYTEV